MRQVGIDARARLRDEQRKARRYPDAEAITREILRRVESGIPVNAGEIEEGSRRDTALLQTARELFGGWDAALASAGIDAASLKRKVAKAAAAKRIKRNKQMPP